MSRITNSGENGTLALTAGKRLVACILCVALGCWGIVPAALAEPDQNDSTVFVEDVAEPAEPEGQEPEAAEPIEEPQVSEPEANATESPNANETAKTGSSTELEKSAEIKKVTKKTIAEEAKLATAEQAIKRMNDLGTKLELAYEDLNEQKTALSKIKKSIKETKKNIKAADEDLDAAKIKVAQYVRESYVNGRVRYLSVLLNSTTFADFVSHLMFLDMLTENEQKTVEDMEKAKENLDAEKEKLVKQRKKQEELTKKSEENAKVVEDALLEQSEYFSALPAKVRNKVLKYDGIKNSIPVAAGATGSHSTKGSHPEVVTEALKYLGVPYVWGGETPSGFDCSGLTMYCYEKAAGKSLTHFARTQFSEGKRIAKSALMPGDLVFFGDSIETIHHVGIYMGNDKFIHAPHTGDVVKISTLSNRSDYIGACRP